MIVAPHTISESVVQSPGGLSLRYTQYYTLVPDGCSECSATGKVRYSTLADLRRYSARLNCDCGCCCNCDDYGPDRSGEKTCTTCNGAGFVPGNGPLHLFSLSPEPQIAMVLLKKLKLMDQEVTDHIKRIWP